ncbi:MAG: hypothetical protein P4L71_06940 [Acetobacteraceae bacterium]|nr:hypothetical protein [Acetobacteraceae bacterium]
MQLRSILLAAAAGLAFGLASPTVHAQSPVVPQSPVVGASGDVAVTVVRAKVTAIDAKTRQLTFRGPAGNVFQVVAGPGVHNFAQIRRGDDLVLRYVQSVAYVITKPGTKLPDVAVTDAGAHAAPGSMPGVAAARRVAITGLIVGVDPVGHVLSVVDQHGGSVRDFAVRDPERQAEMGSLEVGQMITVVFTEAVALAVEPPHRH